MDIQALADPNPISHATARGRREVLTSSAPLGLCMGETLHAGVESHKYQDSMARMPFRHTARPDVFPIESSAQRAMVDA